MMLSDACLSDVCLSVAYIGSKSRTERPSNTKIGRGSPRHAWLETPLSRSTGQRSRSPGRFGWLFKSLHSLYGRHHILRYRPERAAACRCRS